MDISSTNLVRALRTCIAALRRRHFAGLLVFVAAALLAGACNTDNVLAPGSEPSAPLFFGDVFAPAVPGDPQISAGDQHTCALRADGSIACWGWNGFGQTTVPAGSYTQVSAGHLHTCALQVGGSIVCWGSNGHPHTDNRATPPAGNFTQVSTGASHGCGLKADGGIVCWGDSRGAPPAGNYAQVSAGNGRTCAVKTDGGLACSGLWGTSGAPPAGSFTQVSASANGCAVKVDGGIACWGFNFGVQPVPGGDYSQVSVGDSQRCALRTNGGIVCWTVTQFNTVQVVDSPAGSYTQVSAGWTHNCAVRTDGAIVCWGSNASGQTTPQDQDGDGVLDNADNCPTIANADQADSDGDGIGDACANQAPVANAGGPYSMLTSSASVALDGSASSDPDAGDAIASYVWKYEGSTIANGAAVDVPASSLNAAGISAAGTYTLQLTVADSRGATGSATATLTVVSDADGDGIPDVSDNCPAAANADQSDVDGDGIGDACDDTDDRNQAPVANAGPDEFHYRTSAAGVEITLNGSASSDSDGTIVAYTWSKNGTNFATGPTPKHVFGLGLHVVKLVVTDNGGLTAEDFMTIEVQNQAPVAVVAGFDRPDHILFRTSAAGVEVMFDGSASSDVDGTIVSYNWRLLWTQGLNGTFVVDGATFATAPTPRHVLGLGKHLVDLTVTDNDGATGLDGVFITVNNQPPVAVIANPNRTLECVNGGAVAIFDGSGSRDADGTITGYRWSSWRADSAGPLTAFLLPVERDQRVLLTVTDNDGATGWAEANITVQDTRPPTIDMLVSPTEVWPPNGRMVKVASVSAADACDSSPVLTISVQSNESPGFKQDHIIERNADGGLDVYVLAERSEDGTGRIYTITATAGDASANVSSQTGTVTVPHNPNRGRPRNVGK